MKKETIIELITIIILTVILGILVCKTIELGNKPINMQMPQQPNMSNNDSNVSEDAKGATQITDEESLSGEYKTTNADESTIKVSNGGNLTLENATINKSGDSTNTENSEFYGVNAGILTTSESTTIIKNSKIETNAKGANAIFATGENAKVYVYDTTIQTTGESSARGLDSTYSGYIEADNVTVSTQGGSSAALATDRGEGTVIAKNSNLSTQGAGSPVIYSTGDITIENTQGTATGAQMVVVEGKNTATVKNSNLTCSGAGNRNNVDNCGIMIYQSMSGDAGEGTGIFNAENSTLQIASNSNYYTLSPFFFVTNTKAQINLNNNIIKYGSNVLLKIEGTSEWGNSGNNGGEVTLNASNQELVGNIIVDKLSTLEINLENNSSLEGAINSENTAKSITLKLDASSTLTLTNDTYITNLEAEDEDYSNINFNGYKLYVNGKALM